MDSEKIRKEMRGESNARRAKILRGFFKTGKGEYGEGDVFIGVTVPAARKIAKKHAGISLKGVKTLLSSRVHEERLVSLLILVDKYCRGDETERARIFRFYLQNTRHINNWDLVDLSAPKIVGEHLLGGKRSVLYSLAKSGSLWKRRIAIVSTLAFIRNNDFKDTFRITESLMEDGHDLIHKACGWMLREAGKRDTGALKAFLGAHLQKMPRTMLRYAIERFSGKERKRYLER